MKKIAFVAIGATLLSMASCNTTAEKAETNEKDLATKIENCTNPDSMKVYVDQAKEYAQKLINEGKIEEAKKYLDQIEPVVKEKAPALSDIFSTIKAAADQIPDAAAAAADQKVEEGKEAVKEAADEQKAKAAEAVNDAANKVDEKVTEAANKANEKVNDAANKAADKIKNAF